MSRFARRLQQAQTTAPMLYLSPNSGSYTNGSTITVAVRENSYGAAVNSVQANLSYPTAKLQLQTIDTSTGTFTTELQNTGGSGTIQIGVGLLGSSVTGDNLVATITFTVIATGSAALTYTAGSGIASTETAQDICKIKTGATYTLT